MIARCNSVVLVERGRRLVLVDQGGAGLEVVVFVGALGAFVVGANGLLQLLAMPWVGAGLLVLSALAGAVAWQAWRVRRRLHAAEGRVRMSFDTETRLVHDGSGAAIASFDEVRLERTWQVASSYRALTLRYPSGAMVLARGSPFAGGVDDVETGLLERGIGRGRS